MESQEYRDLKRASCARAAAIFIVQSHVSAKRQPVAKDAAMTPRMLLAQRLGEAEQHSQAQQQQQQLVSETMPLRGISEIDRKHILNIWSLRQTCPNVHIHSISDHDTSIDLLEPDVFVNMNAQHLKQVDAFCFDRIPDQTDASRLKRDTHVAVFARSECSTPRSWHICRQPLFEQYCDV